MLCCYANRYENANSCCISMIDFMPGNGEHETGMFDTFTGKVVRRRGVTFMTT